MKTAVLQVADVGPLDSLVLMLRHAGYRCLLPSKKLQAELRSLGCDTVLDVDDLVRGGSYDPPAFPLDRADALRPGDLYVSVKAHRDYAKVVGRWPHLRGRVLWYRINGGRPEHVVNERGDHGDEVNPPCPVLTPNQWYGLGQLGDYTDRFYACWPPFVRWDDYQVDCRVVNTLHSHPMCLVHNVAGWGYGPLVKPLTDLGVCIFGSGSPYGEVAHKFVPEMLTRTLAYVHLKSNDAPGYAIYEAMAAGCPVVVPRRLIWRCRMGALLEEGVTCLCFDRETHDPLSPEDVGDCTREVKSHLVMLRDPEYNRAVGLAGRERLKSVMWREDRDGPAFCEWMGRMFPDA
jgi:hypothetical protein